MRPWDPGLSTRRLPRPPELPDLRALSMEDPRDDPSGPMFEGGRLCPLGSAVDRAGQIDLKSVEEIDDTHCNRL